jgi:hypothetical protein
MTCFLVFLIYPQHNISFVNDECEIVPIFYIKRFDLKYLYLTSSKYLSKRNYIGKHVLNKRIITVPGQKYFQ